MKPTTKKIIQRTLPSILIFFFGMLIIDWNTYHSIHWMGLLVSTAFVAVMLIGIQSIYAKMK